MKYAKMLGLLAVAAAALMAFAGTASATQLTGAGGTVLGVGTTIHAEAETAVTLHPPIGSITCKKSTVHGVVTNAGSATTTVGGHITPNTTTPPPGTKGLTFEECNAEVVVLNTGTLEIHTKTPEVNDNNGTLTSSGARVTVVYNGFHCIFETNGTDLGTVTGSANTGTNATLDIEATIPRVAGSSGFFCGQTAQWTGAYKVGTPHTLNIH